MRIANLKGPLGLKKPRAEKQPRKPMRKVSAKRAAYRASKEGVSAKSHIAAVKAMACVVCGKAGPSDAHHCRSQPPEGDKHYYRQLPAASRKSSDFDTIPLCRCCHEARHNSPMEWLRANGPDYGFLPLVRAALSEPHEIDF